MPRRTITVTLDVATNLDPHTLEARIENWLCPERLKSELLGDERVKVKTTRIAVATPKRADSDDRAYMAREHMEGLISKPGERG